MPSLLASRPALRRRWGVLHNSDRSVCRHESCISYAAHVFLCDFFQAVDVIEQLTPISVASLIDCELRGESAVVSEATNQIGLRPCLYHLQLGIRNVLRLYLVDLFFECGLEFRRRVSLTGNRVKAEHTWVLDTGIVSKTDRLDGDSLIANQRTVEA